MRRDFQTCTCTVGCDACRGFPHVEIKITKMTPHGRKIHDKEETKKLEIPEEIVTLALQQGRKDRDEVADVIKASPKALNISFK